MYSKVKSMGHPLHLMLVNFPLGLWVTAAVFDIVRLVTGNGYWSGVAFWMIAAGSVGGVLAALTGVTDWTGIPKDTRAKQVGIVHGVGNAIVLTLFIVSWLLRLNNPDNPLILAYVLSFLGAALVGLTGWLGGELTGRYGIGIEEDANINAYGPLLPSKSATTHADHSEIREAHEARSQVK
jgi:uncharacterized membrane protein